MAVGWDIVAWYSTISAILFPFITYCILVFIQGDQTLVATEHVFETQHGQRAQTAFLTALLLDFVCWYWSAEDDKAHLFRLVFVINGAPIITYGLLESGIAPIILDSRGRPLMYLRYLHWFFTSPAIILLYAKIFSASSLDLAVAVIADVLCIICGLFASILSFPFDLISVSVSFLCFSLIMNVMNKMFSSAIRLVFVIEFHIEGIDDNLFCRSCRRQQRFTRRGYSLPPLHRRRSFLCNQCMVRSPLDTLSRTQAHAT